MTIGDRQISAMRSGRSPACHRRGAFLLCALISLLPPRASAMSAPVVHPDSMARVWVFFTDKGSPAGNAAVSARALARRRGAGFPGLSAADRPVSARYLADVERAGGVCRHAIPWINAASFAVPPDRVSELGRLPFVLRVTPVKSLTRRPAPAIAPAALPKLRAGTDSWYGPGAAQLDVLSIPVAHRYLAATGAPPGTGVLIGVFDTGFFLDHPCFARLRSRGGVVAVYDFVGRDPEAGHPDNGGGSHGTAILGLLAGYDPGRFVGAAWGARYLLARTEDDFGESHLEEDNWAAAMVWAESLGVDIVTSSLGYRSDFDDGSDYPFSAMDGKTAIISVVADSAVKRGVVVVNAMGNDRQYLGDTSISAPADVEGVVSVGAVDLGLRIAGFSSTGPTADGRIKPDVVGPGVGIVGPLTNPASPSGYTYIGNGTSYATPLVASVCALILQSRGPLSGDSVRTILYRGCHLSPQQTSVDNVYGRGIPDALLSCLKPDEVHVSAVTDLAAPVPQTQIVDSSGAVLGVTDSAGEAVVRVAAAALPASLSALSPWRTTVSFTVGATPARQAVEFVVNRTVAVSVRDDRDTAIPGASVWWRLAGSARPASLTADSAGIASITYFSLSSDTMDIWARAGGHLPSDTFPLACTQHACTLRVTLARRTQSRFALYPNVLSSRTGRSMKAEFVLSDEDALTGLGAVRLCVRAPGGALVWQSVRYVNSGDPVTVEFDGRNGGGRWLSPGVYLFLVSYGGKQYGKKFVVTD